MNVCDYVVSHIEWIERIARRFCKDKSEAADLAGETIIKCLCQPDRFDTSKSFKPWVLAIMANTFRTQYNRKKRILFTGYDYCENFVSPIHTDDFVIYKELLKTVDTLDKRSVCIRCVFLYIEGYTYAEIADIVGIKEGTVKSRIRDGRRLLRKHLCDM